MIAKGRAFLLIAALAGLMIFSACSLFPANQVIPPVNTDTPLPSAKAIQELPAVTPSPKPAASLPEPTLTQPPSDTPTSGPVHSVTTFPDARKFQWKAIIGGLARPVDLVQPADGSGRLFIVEQGGTILVFKDGVLLAQPFLDISQIVSRGGNEQGLLGLALSPQFVQDGRFFIDYTDRNGNTVIARWQVSSNLDQADPESEKIILQQEQPFSNHNGGRLAFGPDGFLYIGMGDGGSQGDPQGNGQNPNTLLGKLLRIDVKTAEHYTIPADNPFARGGGKPEIWALGLRNPWRFSFDRLTGDLYIGDVGQDAYEEIDFQPAGGPGGINYGWNYREGMHPFKGEPPAGLKLTDPVFEYAHPTGCSVIGGFVYRGQSLPEWQGVYLFGDYCQGQVWGMLRDPQGGFRVQELFRTGATISSFGQDQAGEIYLLDLQKGQVLRLERNP